MCREKIPPAQPGECQPPFSFAVAPDLPEPKAMVVAGRLN